MTTWYESQYNGFSTGCCTLSFQDGIHDESQAMTYCIGPPFTELKFDQYQAADVQWSGCTTSTTCTYSSKQPGKVYKIPYSGSFIAMPWAAGAYAKFVYDSTGNVNYPWLLKVYSSTGTVLDTVGYGRPTLISSTGQGFFFYGDGGTSCIFLVTSASTTTLGGSFTGTLNPTIAQINTFAAAFGSAMPISPITFSQLKFSQYQWSAPYGWDSCFTTGAGLKSCTYASQVPGALYRIPYARGLVDPVPAGGYVAFTYNSMNPYPWIANLYDATGSYVEEIGSGKPSMIDSGGRYFFFVGSDAATAFFFYTQTMVSTSSGGTFYGTVNPSAAELDDFASQYGMTSPLYPAPTAHPTASSPSGQPSGQPSSQPSGQPSGQPSRQPSGQPSSRPTEPLTPRPTMVVSPGPYHYRSYHSGSSCLSVPSRYVIEPYVIASCMAGLTQSLSPIMEPSARYMYTCKTGQIGGMYTVSRKTFPASDGNCSGLALSSTVIRHSYSCDNIDGYGYSLGSCGDISPRIRAAAALVLKSYRQPSSSNGTVCAQTPFTSAYLLNVCSGYKSKGEKKLQYNRMLSFVSSRDGVLVIQEGRFETADTRCRSVAYSKLHTLRARGPESMAGGMLCMSDMLDSSLAYTRAMYYDGSVSNWAVVEAFIRS